MEPPPFSDNDPFSYPAARKPDSNDPLYSGQGSSFDPTRGFSDQFANDEQNTGNVQGFPPGGPFGELSGPYGSPVPSESIVPPPPPITGTRLNLSPNRRLRRRIIGLLAIAALLLLFGATFLYVYRHNPPSSDAPPAVAIATDTIQPTFTLPPTPTLLPGETPLPTRVPTATPVPVYVPPQPTRKPNPSATPAPTATPLPTPTPIPYASSANVTVARVTKAAIASPATVNVNPTSSDSRLKTTVGNETGTATNNATSNDLIPATVYTATVNVVNPNPSGGASLQSNSGTPISTQNGNYCTLTTTITVAANTSTTQPCAFPAGAIASYWMFYTAGNSLQYTNNGYPSSQDKGGGSNAYYVVPANCGDATTVSNNAKSALQSKLNADTNGTAVFDTAIGTVSVSCTPAAGQPIASGAGYTQNASVSGSQAGYNPSGVQAFQATLVAADSGYQITSTATCSAPSVATHDTTSATINCQATGTEAPIIDKTSLAINLSSQTTAAAIAYLNAIPSIVSGSAQISLNGGGSSGYLPQNPSNISIAFNP